MRLHADQKCRECGAEIAFVQAEATQRLMPVDPAPVPDGNLVIRNGQAVAVGNDLLSPEARQGEPRYKTHFATCTNPERFRRKRRK
jgi:hypothetical protein